MSARVLARVAAISLGILSLAGCSASPRSPVSGEAVELELQDLDGERLSLTALRGKVVLVDVWATWCNPCVRALPTLERLSRARPDDLAVIGISTDRDRGALKSFLAAKPVSYFVAVEDAAAREAFRVSVLPTIFILDREGRLVDKLIGNHAESAILAAASRHF